MALSEYLKLFCSMIDEVCHCLMPIAKIPVIFEISSRSDIRTAGIGDGNGTGSVAMVRFPKSTTGFSIDTDVLMCNVSFL